MIFALTFVTLIVKFFMLILLPLLSNKYIGKSFKSVVFVNVPEIFSSTVTLAILETSDSGPETVTCGSDNAIGATK